MKAIFSVDSRSHNYSVEEQFSIAKDAGFDGIDYIANLRDIFIYPEKILQFSRQYQIPILGIHSPLPLVVITPAFLFNSLFTFIKRFPDCQMYSFHLSGLSYPFADGLKNTAKLMQTANTSNIEIAFESNPGVFPMQIYPKETYNPECFAEFCKLHNLPVTFDTSHIAQQGYDIVSFFKKYHKQIKLIHLSDFKNSEQHLPLGKGELPLKQLFQEMKKILYRKLVVFEIYTFSQKSTKEDILAELKNSLRFFRQYTE